MDAPAPKDIAEPRYAPRPMDAVHLPAPLDVFGAGEYSRGRWMFSGPVGLTSGACFCRSAGLPSNRTDIKSGLYRAFWVVIEITTFYRFCLSSFFENVLAFYLTDKLKGFAAIVQETNDH